jgi:DNA-directed RNA polymerase beta subunit
MEILTTWFNSFPSGSFHINSFLEWKYYGLKKTICNQQVVSKNKTWKFVDARLLPPTLTPSMARLMNLTFDSKIEVDVEEIDNTTGKSIMLPNIFIGKVPMIVLPDDIGSDGIGGFFIINGIDRVLVTQIHQSYNQPIISISKNETKKNRVKSEELYSIKLYSLEEDEEDGNPKNVLVDTIRNTFNKKSDSIEIQLTLRSISEESNHSCATEIIMTKQGQFLFGHSKIKGRLNIGIVLKALGCETLEQFESILLNDEEAALLIFNSSLVAENRKNALEILSKEISFIQRTVEEMKMSEVEVSNFLTLQLFPHLGFVTTSNSVAFYIGTLIKQIFDIKRDTSNKFDDRDSLRFKRFEPAGYLVGDLFNQTIKKWINHLTRYCQKRESLIVGIQPSFIEKKIAFCFSTGTWGLQQNFKRMGVSQVRATSSYSAQISHLHRVSNPISKETRNQPIRQLHPSHAFFICPCESPEGQTVGIVLNFAIGVYITCRVSPTLIIDAISHMISPINYYGRETRYVVFINGKTIGCTNNKEDFFREFYYRRRLGIFDGGVNQGMVSIGIINRQIMIWSDEGRAIRLVKTKFFDNSVVNWRSGLLSGKLQWIDSFEQEYGIEDFSWENEIHTSTLFGLMASIIPFVNYQPAPRAVYACSMNKQSVCSLGPTQCELTGTTLNIGRYQHKPLVTTLISEIKGMNEYPTGINVIVGICPYYGFNQEDAIVLNRSSVQRGLFAADVYKSIFAEESFEGTTIKKFCIPPNKLWNNNNNYCMLDSDGIVRLGSKVYVGDVIIGQISQRGNNLEDISYVISKGEEGYIHKIYRFENDGFRNIKIVICGELEVVIGDKFSSRFGQKGICGHIANSWDMPFMDDGTTCDILINPLCLPSRMTIPTIMEGLFGLVALEEQKYFTSSTFDDVEDVRSKMELLGLDSSGSVEMRNSINGKKMKKIFVAPMYYQRLAHMAMFKCYARSKGIMSKHTRQPTDGRSRMGGLRFGEMERDAIIGLSMPHVLEDRLFFSSDPFWINICSNCKQLALNKSTCLCGGEQEQITNVKCSFSSNLIFAQLKSMGCMINFGTREEKLSIKKIDESSESSESSEEDSDDSL